VRKYLEFMLSETNVEPFGLPDGVVFLYGDELIKLEEKEKLLSSLFEKNDFAKVVPPVFEFYETFEKGGGVEVARRSFSFKDKDGRLLSLRFDMTTPIARMISVKYTNRDMPLRLYYCGNVFREQPFHKGKKRQIRQAGIEVIGSNSIETDIEVIELFCQAISLLSKEYIVVVGDVRIYKKLLSLIDLDEHKLLALETIFNKKDITSLEILMEDINCDEKIKKAFQILLESTGSIEYIKEKLKKINLNGEISRVIEEFFMFFERIDKKLKDKIIVDFALLKDFSYYSSLIFEGYVKGSGYPVGGGGRYDDLFKKFERDYPAIGFAIQID
jgi:ATP phosphoribosyltransferase regulatory subunit